MERRRDVFMTRAQAIARQVRRFGIAGILLVALSGAFDPISAQIYEWVDAAGDRHFATSLEQVPEEVRAQARTVVAAGTPSTADGASAAMTAGKPNPDQSERDDSFESGWDAGFRAGYDAGYRTAAEEQPVCPAEPEAVVLESRPPVVVNVPLYDPSGAYYRSPYDSSLTVPFDDGASRGLTSRNLIQERRAIERGW
jgi:hypothetical protein